MKTLELGLCIFFSSLLFSCNADDLLTYRFGEYLKYENIEPKSLRDSVDQYIFCISEKIKNDAPCWYFPQINSVDVSFHMSTIDGDTYLGGLGDFIIPFAKSSYKLIAAGTYLRYTYRLRKGIFDQILRECIRLDVSNHEALYLLSQLRYEAGYVKEAKYLMKILLEKNPNNKEVKRLYDRMNKTETAYFKTSKNFCK